MLVAGAFMLLAFAPTANAALGPDSFGYKGKDNLDTGGPKWSWTDISGTPGTTALTLGYGGFQKVPIGFTINYYGNAYNDVFMFRNGFLQFGTNPVNQCTSPIPYQWTWYPNNHIAGYSNCYYVGSSCAQGEEDFIEYRTEGSSPFRIFTAQWKNMHNWNACSNSSYDPSTFQIKLYENKDYVEVYFKKVNHNNYWHSSGIEDSTGYVGLQYLYGTQSYTNRVVRYYYNLAPEADEIQKTVLEDSGPFELKITDYVYDGDNDPMEVVKIQPAPLKGTAVLDATKTKITYTPFDEVNTADGVPDTYGVWVKDTKGALGIAEVEMFITPVNDPPTFDAFGDVTVLEDSGSFFDFDWAANLSPGPSQDEKVQKVKFTTTNDNPDLFSIQPFITNSGGLVFEPAPHQNGVATVTYTAKDTGGTSDGGLDTLGPQTFLITVLAVNDAPDFTPGGAIKVGEDSGAFTKPWATGMTTGPAEAPDEAAQTTQFLVDVPDPAIFSQQPMVSNSGVLSFTPADNACSDSPIPATVRIKDTGGVANGGTDMSAPKPLPLTILCVNDPPTVEDVTLKIVKDTVDAFVPVVTSDPDIGDQVSILWHSTPQVGSVKQIPGGFAYTPPVDWTGDDSFIFKVADQSLAQATGSAKIVVYCPGVEAKPDAYFGAEDTPLVVNAASGLISDDDFLNAATVTLEAPFAKKGTVNLQPNGAFTYTPDADANGIDVFQYRLHDGNCTSAALVTIDLAAANDPPTAVDDYFQVAENTATLLPVLANDSPEPDTGETLTVASVTSPLSGGAGAVSGGVLYTPNAGYVGGDTFTYTVSDGNGGTAVATVGLLVVNKNDAPLGVPDSYVLRPGINDVSAGRGVLANDVDPDGDAMTAALMLAPKHGALTLFPDGSFKYEAHNDHPGPDGFQYVPMDAAGLLGAPVRVDIQVRANESPEADFEPGKENVLAGIPVRFFDRSKDFDGFITSWAWSIDGVGSSSEVNPTVTFDKPGDYTIRLTVHDNDGASDTTVQSLRVTAEYAAEQGGTYTGDRPEADAGPDQEVTVHDLVRLDGTKSDTALALQWRQIAGPPVDLVDRETLKPAFVAPSVGLPTTLEFELVIFDGHRDSFPDTVQIHVLPGTGASEPFADAGPDRFVQPGEEVLLQGSAGGFDDVLSFRWVQVSGSGVTLTAEGPTASFLAPGVGAQMVFALTASDGREQATDMVRIIVTSADGFTLEAAKTVLGDVFRFHALDEGTYFWDFGDGATSTDRSPAHVYEGAGTYTVSLTVDGEDGVRTFSRDVTVGEAKGTDKDAPLPLLVAVVAIAAAFVRRRT